LCILIKNKPQPKANSQAEQLHLLIN